jgi:hypothetical protein
MDAYIAFLQDAGVRFPIARVRDPVVDEIKATLTDLVFADFHVLSIYMHLPGPDNTFGMAPGVSLRLNRKEKELVARCVLDGQAYMGLKSDGERLNACIAGVVQTLDAVFRRYKRPAEEVAWYLQQLELIARRV